MGTWSTKIDGSDAFQDIYQGFFEQYNEGQNPTDVSQKIQDDFAEMFEDAENRHDSLFGLALAQWETKSQDPALLVAVQQIVESKGNLESWRQLGADEKTLKKRQKELEAFWMKISIERERPKRRTRPRFKYESVSLLKLVAPDHLKVFEISEGYVNGEYNDTHALLMWARGGGGIFSFRDSGKFVAAKWIDSSLLEISYDKSIEFTQKREQFFFRGDGGVIRYVEVS